MPTVTPQDEVLLDLFRQHSGLTIKQLGECLGVTATAVRHKLDRLIALGLVECAPHRAGRGRPANRYELTEGGRRHCGNNLGDLAQVLWEELARIPDPRIRLAVLSGVGRRLAEKYGEEMGGATLNERLQTLASLLSRREIPVRVESRGGLPVLKIHGCPYPDLVAEDHSICELETELFSRLIGHPIKRDRCRQPVCCTFEPDDGEPSLAAAAGG